MSRKWIWFRNINNNTKKINEEILERKKIISFDKDKESDKLTNKKIVFIETQKKEKIIQKLLLFEELEDKEK